MRDAGATGPSVDGSAPTGASGVTTTPRGTGTNADTSVVGIVSLERLVDAGEPSPDAAVPRLEHCTNGLDDDADGKTDCEDHDCAGFECVAVPAGWTGPSALWSGAEPDLPFCPAPFVTAAVVGRVGPVAASAVCPACECTNGDAECLLEAQGFTTADCSGDVTASGPLRPNLCERVPTAGSLSLTARARGTCAPRSRGAVQLPAVTWDAALLVCDTPRLGKGCTGAACVERPAAPFEATLCVHREGERECPAGFPGRHVAYAAYGDSRACSECSCGEATCGGSADGYVNELCGVGERDVPIDGTCTPIVDPSPGNGLSLAYDANAPTCAVVPSAPRGQVVGTGATTICCR